MTNTEIWLDEIISHIQSVKSDLWMLHEIMSLPNCNDCKNKDCEYKPKWGEHIRYNCPLHNADRKTEPTCSKMEQVEDEPHNNCKDLQDWKDQMWTEAMRSCGFNVDGYRQGQPTDEPQTDCAWREPCGK